MTTLPMPLKNPAMPAAVAIFGLLLLCPGCGEDGAPRAARPSGAKPAAAKRDRKGAVEANGAPGLTAGGSALEPIAGRPGDRSRSPNPQSPAPSPQPPAPTPQPPATAKANAAAVLPRPRPDDAALAAQGIHRYASQRLVLYSDLPPEQVRDLPPAVDALFEEWAAYFGLGAQAVAPDSTDSRQTTTDQSSALRSPLFALRTWQATGYLMTDERRFRELGLLPAEIPPSPNGQARGMEFWLHDQPTDYYRRHLLLHEATHCFLESVVRPPPVEWHAEGLAELFGTHALRDGRWVFRCMPPNRDAVPGWARIRLIRDAIAERRARSIDDIRFTPRDPTLPTERYAWCWALVTFLDGHPRYQDRFRVLARLPARESLDKTFDRVFQQDRSQLDEEWQLFVANLEYGYDVVRTVIDFKPGTALAPEETRTITIAADQGWQNAGILLEAGHTYVLTAAGRYSIANEPRIWWCEPGGISVRYYQGRPIGRLLAAIRPDSRGDHSALSTQHSALNSTPTGLLAAADVGLAAALHPEVSGTLYFRVNDAWGELGDNRGELQVTIATAD